ncbi:MAG: flavodoxin family protein [Lachnospiraceae bacterium]|nr:flavodoxin family protein [Lachnospiraceae bacterium]
MKKKVLILNGSPTKGGNTETLADSFKKGAEEAGHDVVKLNLDEYEIAPFRGMQQKADDFGKVLAELNSADVVVWATPFYWMQFTAQIKLVMDRMAFASENNFAGKEVVLLATAASPVEKMQETIVSYYQMCFVESVKWKDRGMVLAGGTPMPGAIAGTPYLEQAYELGKSI